MVPAQTKDAEISTQFQKGYCVVPISADDHSAVLRLCIMVRSTAGPVGGFFIHLRDMPDAMVFLGCLIDAGGFVHEWVELWLQNPNNAASTLHYRSEEISNRNLDERWSQRVRIMSMVDRASMLQLTPSTPTPSHPLPIFFNIAMTAPTTPRDKGSNAPWELCTNDQLLEENGLPPYSRSLARYLYLRDSKAQFIPVTAGAPESKSTVKIQQALGALVPFNPWCGLMMARKFAPLGFEAYLGILSGIPWKGIEHGEKIVKLGGVYRELLDPETVQRGDAHLFLAKFGRAGRLVEAFYLKLDLLAQAFRLVHTFVQEEQMPFLNLCAESFRVALAETGVTLPFLWSAKVVLAVPGSALALPVKSSDARYFFSREITEASIYRPQVADRIVEATGALKIERITAHDGGALSIEGTLSTQEQIRAAETDLLSISLMLSPGRIDLHGHLSPAATGTARNFRTLPQEFSEAFSMALRSAEGTSFSDVSFGTLPSVSSPCDLYSLGVLGVRSLLVNDANTLPAALEEFLALATACANFDGGKGDLRERVRAVVAKDPRWAASLGPHRILANGQIPVEEASTYLPSDLWWNTVAMLMPCFSGHSRDARCAHLGDAPAQQLEAVFDPVIGELDDLLGQIRSYLFIDAKSNTEINNLVRAALRKHTEEPAAPKP